MKRMLVPDPIERYVERFDSSETLARRRLRARLR